MKSKILLSIFCIVLFAAGLVLGWLGGTSASAGSNVSQLYAGALELRAIHHHIDKQDYAAAKRLICNSLKARHAILELAKPAISSRKSQEVEALYQSVLFDNVQRTLQNPGEGCQITSTTH